MCGDTGTVAPRAAIGKRVWWVFFFSIKKKKPKVNPKVILYSGISNESSIKVKECFKNREYGFSRPLGSTFIKIRSICLDMCDINSVL